MTTRQLVRTALFAALTAVGAFLKIPLGPSAITLQFFFTAMAGCLLGSGCGALSQLIYVLLDCWGCLFSPLAAAFPYVLHPTFGFLLGLIPPHGSSVVWPAAPAPSGALRWRLWWDWRCCMPWGCRTWR